MNFLDIIFMVNTVILAAGKGNRMYSNKPKVLQKLASKPLLGYVLDVAKEVSDNIYIVCGYKKDVVSKYFADIDANWVVQKRQLGTADALNCALKHINDGIVLILYGDVPLIQKNTINSLLNIAKDKNAAILSAKLDNPSGYGRIIRNANNDISAIVEDKDANAQQIKICEINTGIMAVKTELLQKYINKLTTNNAKKELYLTDIVGVMFNDGIKFSSFICPDKYEIAGVNDNYQLMQLARVLQKRYAKNLMQQGLQLSDYSRFDCRGDLSFGKDCFIDINVIINGKVILGNNVIIQANCIINDSKIDDNTTIYANSIIDNASVGKNVSIGPFARIRPETKLIKNSKIGNFVEIKKSIIGENSKIGHLSYIGDSDIGSNVNIGAGVITCNYDGKKKYKTYIGNNAFIGSNSQLIAPINIGSSAIIGAGSTITKDAPKNEITITRSKQRSIKKPKTNTKKD